MIDKSTPFAKQNTNHNYCDGINIFIYALDGNTKDAIYESLGGQPVP